MPLLREEAEKLSNNELEQGVIETIIDRDDLFAILPFMKINSKAYLYNREKTLSEATFIDVNDTIPEGAATFEECVAKLRILAGDVDAARLQVLRGLVRAAVAELHFRCFRALGEGHHLVAQADAEDGYPAHHGPYLRNFADVFGRVAGAVGEHDAVVPGGQDCLRARVMGIHRDGAAALY